MAVKSEKLSALARSLIVPTVGQVFEDGTFLELLSVDPRSRRLSLLCRRGKRSWTGRQLRVNGSSYAPADIPATVLRNMYLPARAAKYGSTRALFDELVRTFERTRRLPSRDSQLSAYFIIATAFVDCLRIAPCLAVVASDTGDAVQFLQVLGAASRHAFCWQICSPSGLTRLPQGLYPTLLFSQSSFSSAAVRSLLASQRRGFGVLQSAGITDLTCAKAMIIDEGTPEELFTMPGADLLGA